MFETCGKLRYIWKENSQRIYSIFFVQNFIIIPEQQTKRVINFCRREREKKNRSESHKHVFSADIACHMLF